MYADPINFKGYKLLHEGTDALAEVEANGIKIDVDLLNSRIEKTKRREELIYKKLKKTKIWQKWKKKYGTKAKITSGGQLVDILFNICGYSSGGARTASGKYSYSEEALESLDIPFANKILEARKLHKAWRTYLVGIQEELDGDLIHPVYNLHIPVTYRSSSDSPNFQNQPVRIPEIAKLIRENFISRPGSLLVESDFKGIEVGVSACYNKDPKLIDYINDETMDMHRDMAAQIFELDPKQVSKNVRYSAKNGFVFPEFYGDWYVSCANYMWDMISKLDLKGPNDIPMLEWLDSRGISELGEDKDSPPGTFIHHLKEVEHDFWKNRFRVYDKWKYTWNDEFLKKGYFDTLTGFRIGGILSKKEVTNYPIQGSAFHCLLWCLIQVQKIMKRKKMKSVIVGQIHDSILGDIRLDELDLYFKILRHVVEEMLPKYYTWINVPLVLEYELCPVEGNWNDKQEVEFDGSVYKFQNYRSKRISKIATKVKVK